MTSTNLSDPVERALLNAKMTTLFKRLPANVRQLILGQFMTPEMGCCERRINVRRLCMAGHPQHGISAHLDLDVVVRADLTLAFRRQLHWVMSSLTQTHEIILLLTARTDNRAGQLAAIGVSRQALSHEAWMTSQAQLTDLKHLAENEYRAMGLQAESHLIVRWIEATGAAA